LLLNAAKYGVLHLKPVGVAYPTTEAVTSILVSELINHGHTVLSPDAMDAAIGDEIQCYESECAADAGSMANVEHVIYGSVSRLGNKHIVQLSIVNVMTKEIVWAGSLAAKTAEDLDTVVRRLAKSISEGKSAEETVEVGMVTEEEARRPVRRRVFHTFGINAGMLQTVGGYGDNRTLYHMGLLYWYETPRIVAEISGYAAFPGSSTDPNDLVHEAVFPEFSVLYMLSKKEISPYIGGGVGFGWLTIDEPFQNYETAYGATLNAGGGLVFFRTYDIRIMLDARYRVNFASISGISGPHQGFKFSIGFTYRPKFRGCFGCGIAY
jgi:hypothetical protein